MAEVTALRWSVPRLQTPGALTSRARTAGTLAAVIEQLRGGRRARPLGEAVIATLKSDRAQHLMGKQPISSYEQQVNSLQRGAAVPLPVRRRENVPQTREPWDPFREITDLQQRLNQLVDSVWPRAGLAEAVWAPLVDIEETDDAWLVEADLPGAKKGDIKIEATDSELAISGEIKERERTGVLRRRTRRSGQFEYRVTLPGDADPDRIEASLNDGVLTVKIPKPERAKPRRIEIRP